MICSFLTYIYTCKFVPQKVEFGWSDSHWFPPVRHVGQAGSAPEMHARARASSAPLVAGHGEGTLDCLEERSLRRVRFHVSGIRAGWSRNPSSSGNIVCRGPQGKVAVDTIVAGIFQKNLARNQNCQRLSPQIRRSMQNYG
jgi:hypothetical protein